MSSADPASWRCEAPEAELDNAGNGYMLEQLESAPPEQERSWFSEALSAIRDGAAYVTDRVGDALDLRENEREKDALEDPKPITRDATPEEWALLRAEVAAFEGEDNRALEAATSDRAALDEGETLSATESRPDGMIEEMTVGVVQVPWEQFVRRVFPADWGRKLYGYEGGEVEGLEFDEQGRPVRQQERMVLETPMSRYLSWMGGQVPALKHLDMTKTEEIEYGDDHARVRWRVYTSDNDTVFQDIGYVNFERVSNGVEITFHSAHKYTDAYNGPLAWGPLDSIGDYVTARSLEAYFKSAIDHYRELAGE